MLEMLPIRISEKLFTNFLRAKQRGNKQKRYPCQEGLWTKGWQRAT